MKKRKCLNKRALFCVSLWLYYGDGTNNYHNQNLQFARDYGILPSNILHLSRYTPTIIARVTRRQMQKMKSDTRCVEIRKWTEKPFVKASQEILETISAEFQRSVNSPNTILGMISSEREIFSPLSPQLTLPYEQGKISVLPYPIPEIPALHPSVVLSQLIGDTVTVDGEIYRGIAEGAGVIFSTSETSTDVLNTIEDFIDSGIRIINFSAGVLNPEGYSDFDRQLDRLIESTDLIFVTASGNRRVVTSPGISFNSITTGNLQTLTFPSTPLSPPWNSFCINGVNCSGYLADETTAHKPDVSAPGSYIPYITPSFTVYSQNTGTSFACPWVSGIAYYLISERPDLTSLQAKAIIALSCNRQDISDEFNPIIEGEQLIRLRTGCGLVNLESSLQILRQGEISTERISENNSATFFLESGQKISVCVCCYMNKERQDERLTLRLVSQKSSVYADRQRQNLHIIEYIAEGEESVTVSADGTVGLEYARVIFIT